MVRQAQVVVRAEDQDTLLGTVRKLERDLGALRPFARAEKAVEPGAVDLFEFPLKEGFEITGLGGGGNEVSGWQRHGRIPSLIPDKECAVMLSEAKHLFTCDRDARDPS